LFEDQEALSQDCSVNSALNDYCFLPTSWQLNLISDFSTFLVTKVFFFSPPPISWMVLTQNLIIVLCFRIVHSIIFCLQALMYGYA